MRKFFTILAAILFTVTIMAQSPEQLSYQAVIRDASGKLVTSHSVGMKVSILKGNAAVYIETHATTTNANGLVSIAIGGGAFVSGSPFQSIDWGNGTYAIKTETDPAGGTNYSAVVGTTQLLSVPFALHAKTAETLTGGVTESDPIFVSWDKSSGISITSSQVTDFNASVANNPAVAANTAKNSYPAADAAKLAAITGINTGDQDLTGKVDIVPGKGLSTNDFTNADVTKLANISGINTGDQDLSGKVDKETGRDCPQTTILMQIQLNLRIFQA
jgi:hypothetical protein